jgi:hypothetical protein
MRETLGRAALPDNCDVGQVFIDVLALDCRGCQPGRVLALHFRDEVIWSHVQFVLN